MTYCYIHIINKYTYRYALHSYNNYAYSLVSYIVFLYIYIYYTYYAFDAAVGLRVTYRFVTMFESRDYIIITIQNNIIVHAYEKKTAI